MSTCTTGEGVGEWSTRGVLERDVVRTALCSLRINRSLDYAQGDHAVEFYDDGSNDPQDCRNWVDLIE